MNLNTHLSPSDKLFPRLKLHHPDDKRYLFVLNVVSNFTSVTHSSPSRFFTLMVPSQFIPAFAANSFGNR
ncbi:hypothetical protein Hanom_Chr16g01515621 [Helianthus anomalus]